jgi:hypothetical protein
MTRRYMYLKWRSLTGRMTEGEVFFLFKEGNIGQF